MVAFKLAPERGEIAPLAARFPGSGFKLLHQTVPIRCLRQRQREIKTGPRLPQNSKRVAASNRVLHARRRSHSGYDDPGTEGLGFSADPQKFGTRCLRYRFHAWKGGSL